MSGYKANRKADYRSPLFYKIVETINQTLIENSLEPLSNDLLGSFYIKASKFDVGKYDNKIEWRITHRNAPQLFDREGKIINAIKNKLTICFNSFVADKTIKFGNPLYTKDFEGKLMASIVILLTQLPDNILTKQDLADFVNKVPQAVQKCLEIESRMFKRGDDERSPEKRILDFCFALSYEPVLPTSSLINISGLSLEHQDDIVTLEADPKSDFMGFVNSEYCPIEGKATEYIYINNPQGHKVFANYFRRRVEAGSFGGLHDAKFVLLVLRNTHEVICIEINNPDNNWLAGKVILQENC